MRYEIVPIDPTDSYIITVDDTPMQSSDGTTLRFYREIDAERALERILTQRRPSPPPPGPRLPNPGTYDERGRPPDPGVPEQHKRRRLRQWWAAHQSGKLS